MAFLARYNYTSYKRYYLLYTLIVLAIHACQCNVAQGHFTQTASFIVFPLDFSASDQELTDTKKEFHLCVKVSNTDTIDLQDYYLYISLQEQGNSGSKLQYTDAKGTIYDESIVNRALSSFTSKTHLTSSEEPIILPFKLNPCSGVAQIVIQAALYHQGTTADKKIVHIHWKATSVTQEMIHYATQKNHLFLGHVLQKITEGTPVDISTIDPKTKLTALHQAIIINRIDIAQVLLNTGANINLLDKKGRTPLHVAIIEKQKAWLQFLLDNKADINAPDKDGNTPLHYATHRKNIEAVKLLIQAGADITIQNKHGITPLHLSVIKSLEIAKLLLERNSYNINIQDENLDTPLHWASEHSNRKTTQLLIAKGASTTIRNKDGKTPRDLARTDKIRNLFG